jgi:hypothetical protein
MRADYIGRLPCAGAPPTLGLALEHKLATSRLKFRPVSFEGGGNPVFRKEPCHLVDTCIHV